jgi:ATP/maltotriose-dependent transcriptional regulator MalT
LRREISAPCDTVLVDDLHLLTEPERQQALCALIRARSDLHFVLLGRGRCRAG